MRALFTIAVFFGAFLLFLVEPMAARMILPHFGGSAAVWTTSLLFFQVALLAGYGYAHASGKWLGKAQNWVHVALLAVCLVALPIHLRVAGPASAPSWQVIVTLALMVGLPFFALSSCAPVLQRWFAKTNDPLAHDPYFLYAASNLGSMAALLAYPSLVEPSLGLSAQARLWTYGFAAFVGLSALCAVVARRGVPATDKEELKPPPTPLSNRQRLAWVALAAAPSSLMLGVTTYLTTNIAPIPLLWVIPLALYLLTFIVAFARRKKVTATGIGRWVPVAVTPLALAMILESSEPIVWLAIFHLSVVFVVSLACHTRLSESRPAADHLTEFYLWISVGGAVGGLFNAIFAPAAFTTLAEYPIAMTVACALVLGRPGKVWERKDWIWPIATFVLTFVCVMAAKKSGMAPSPLRTAFTIGLPAVVCFVASDRPYRFALCLGALFWASHITETASDGNVVFSERSFYGVHRIVELPKRKLRELVHGNTTHGIESTDPRRKDEPLTYYSRQGPMGSLFKKLGDRFQHVGLIGLGVGSLAAYGHSGEDMTFFEIDPVVRKVAEDPKLFTFLSDSAAKVSVVSGDGRLTIADQPDARFDLIVLDAFSSDSIPVHLLTEEAVRLYLRKLAPGGVLAFHISNRYLDLSPILAAEARDLGLVCRYNDDSMIDDEDIDKGITPSRWLVMARNQDDVKPLSRTPDWEVVRPASKGWTDEYSNVLGAFRLSP